MEPRISIITLGVSDLARSLDQARQEVNGDALRPVGAWWEPVARYLFVGVSLLVVILQILFRIG